ncbi:MAG: 2-C-methyl-D-erythritol 4-phosphate cytidylyltransferase, partial [Bacteroidota bacterium]
MLKKEKSFRKYAVIVAGGSGTRMNTDTPKQFIKIGKQVILMHTIERYKKADPNIEIVLVLPEKHIDTWYELVKAYDFAHVHSICKGGTSRFQSVKAGLETIATNSIVAI